MTYEKYVDEVRKHFKDIKKTLSDAEINNYFSEAETVTELKSAYKVFSRNSDIASPVSEASDLSLMY